MRYLEVREHIKSGDLLAFSHFGWSSWHDLKIQGVRLMQRSEYSHTGIAWTISERVFCLEAVVPKIRIFPLSALGEFYWLPSPKYYWSPQIEDCALSLVGEEYSQREAIRSFFENPSKENNVWQCCEYVREILRLGGYDLGEVATPTAIVRQAQRLDFPTYLVEPILS